jgi:hypothetical protein
MDDPWIIFLSVKEKRKKDAHRYRCMHCTIRKMEKVDGKASS